MSELKVNVSRFESVKKNAYQARTVLDTGFLPSAIDVDCYIDHIKDCIKTPTVGLIAREKYINKKPKDFPICFLRNKAMMDEVPVVKRLNSELDSKLGKLYPTTAKIREFIIKDGRLNLYNVTKSRGYNMLDKLKLLCKLF